MLANGRQCLASPSTTPWWRARRSSFGNSSSATPFTWAPLRGAWRTYLVVEAFGCRSWALEGPLLQEEVKVLEDPNLTADAVFNKSGEIAGIERVKLGGMQAETEDFSDLMAALRLMEVGLQGPGLREELRKKLGSSRADLAIRHSGDYGLSKDGLL